MTEVKISSFSSMIEIKKYPTQEKKGHPKDQMEDFSTTWFYCNNVRKSSTDRPALLMIYESVLLFIGL